MLLIQLMTLPPTTALLLCMHLCVEVCMLHRCACVCLCIFGMCDLLSCRSRIDEHRHLVESIVRPQWLQIQNSPDPGPRNDILYVTDCIKGKAVRRKRLRNCTGWKKNIIGSVRISGSQTRLLIRRLLLVLPAVSCPIPSTLGSYGHLCDLPTPELRPVLPELLYTRISDTAMMSETSLLIDRRGGATHLLHSCCKISYKDTLHARAHTQRTHIQYSSR